MPDEQRRVVLAPQWSPESAWRSWRASRFNSPGSASFCVHFSVLCVLNSFTSTPFPLGVLGDLAVQFARFCLFCVRCSVFCVLTSSLLPLLARVRLSHAISSDRSRTGSTPYCQDRTWVTVCSQDMGYRVGVGEADSVLRFQCRFP
jgi:hypothetical protein